MRKSDVDRFKEEKYQRFGLFGYTQCYECCFMKVVSRIVKERIEIFKFKCPLNLRHLEKERKHQEEILEYTKEKERIAQEDLQTQRSLKEKELTLR